MPAPVPPRRAAVPKRCRAVPIMIDDVITSIEVELEAAIKMRDKAAAEVKYILKAATDQGRRTLSADEDGRFNDLFTARERAKNAIVGIDAKLRQARHARAPDLDTARL